MLFRSVKEKHYARMYHVLTGFVVNKVKEENGTFNDEDYLHCKD